MKHIAGGYGHYFKHKYDRVVRLFQDGLKREAVEREDEKRGAAPA